MNPQSQKPRGTEFSNTVRFRRLGFDAALALGLLVAMGCQTATAPKQQPPEDLFGVYDLQSVNGVAVPFDQSIDDSLYTHVSSGWLQIAATGYDASIVAYSVNVVAHTITAPVGVFSVGVASGAAQPDITILATAGLGIDKPLPGATVTARVGDKVNVYRLRQ